MNYNFIKYNEPNLPVLNGGLYTGEPFKGPWGNVPVIPDAVSMIHYTLRSANPPPNAILQYGNSIRPGNNGQSMSNVHSIANTNIHCTGNETHAGKYRSFDPNPHEFYQAW